MVENWDGAICAAGAGAGAGEENSQASENNLATIWFYS